MPNSNQSYFFNTPTPNSNLLFTDPFSLGNSNENRSTFQFPPTPAPPTSLPFSSTSNSSSCYSSLSQVCYPARLSPSYSDTTSRTQFVSPSEVEGSGGTFVDLTQQGNDLSVAALSSSASAVQYYSSTSSGSIRSSSPTWATSASQIVQPSSSLSERSSLSLNYDNMLSPAYYAAREGNGSSDRYRWSLPEIEPFEKRADGEGTERQRGLSWPSERTINQYIQSSSMRTDADLVDAGLRDGNHEGCVAEVGPNRPYSFNSIDSTTTSTVSSSHPDCHECHSREESYHSLSGTTSTSGASILQPQRRQFQFQPAIPPRPTLDPLLTPSQTPEKGFQQDVLLDSERHSVSWRNEPTRPQAEKPKASIKAKRPVTIDHPKSDSSYGEAEPLICIRPPTSDLNHPVSSKRTVEQDPTKIGGPEDFYTPRFVRGAGATKEGYCPLCPQGGWYKMKVSSYNYHLAYTHGISATSRKRYTAPTATRFVERKEQALCHNCNSWIKLASKSGVRFSTFYRHARSCHPTASNSSKRAKLS